MQKIYCKHTSAGLRVSKRNLSPMHIHKLLEDTQSQTKVEGVHPRFVGLEEAVENEGLIFS